MLVCYVFELDKIYFAVERAITPRPKTIM